MFQIFHHNRKIIRTHPVAWGEVTLKFEETIELEEK